MQNGYGQSDFQDASKRVMASDVGGAMLNMPKSVPPMDVSMRNLGLNIERLTQAVQILHGKLEPVLYAEPPANQTTQGVEARGPRASSTLGTTINNFADQIDCITERVQSITRRCEL